jgi:uncharacterized membrane protein
VTQLHFGPLSSVAYSINNGGECVGFIHEQTPEGPFNKAVMWKADGTVVYLGGIPGYAHCRALHVNDDGVIAGYCYNSNPPPQTPLQTAFVWRQGVITDLATRTLPTFAKYPAGLNNKGQIASWGNINGPVGALLTPVLGAPGDYNCDKVVNITDLLAVIAHWGPDGGGGPADFNNDGSVNIADLLIVIANWG